MDQFLQKNETLRARVTPDMIMKFEESRLTQGNSKHFNRYIAVQQASEKDAKAVYNKMQGGGGFYEDFKGQMEERAKEMARSRTGAEELERIRAYERRKAEKYRKMKESVDNDIHELTATREAIRNRMNASSAFISSTEEKIELLRKRPKEMERYASIKNLSTPIEEVRGDLKRVEEQKKDVAKLKERMKASRGSRHQALRDMKQLLAEDANGEG